jgi:hypothetical protein
MHGCCGRLLKAVELLVCLIESQWMNVRGWIADQAVLGAGDNATVTRVSAAPWTFCFESNPDFPAIKGFHIKTSREKYMPAGWECTPACA